MIMDTPEQHPLHAPKLNVVPSEFVPTYKDDGITMSIIAPSLFKNKQSPEEAQASADPNKPTPIPIPTAVGPTWLHEDHVVHKDRPLEALRPVAVRLLGPVS